jgi:hypothetical protein
MPSASSAPEPTTVRRAKDADAEACVAIVRDVPDDFTDDVPDKVTTALREHPVEHVLAAPLARP